MKTIVNIILFFLSVNLVAQSTISGTVVDKSNAPVVGANVYLENTYDGATTDENGKFSFTTEETGTQTLIVSFVTYETFRKVGLVNTFTGLKITIAEASNTLDAVELTAGSFQAGDNSKVSVMSPLDVVTTAGSSGDFIAALQTLPGVQTVAEDGRLFVRGGTAEETQVFIDGLNVFKPYSPTANNTPTRGRYSPFLFDGITFSTGGYSAEYGNALSSVLLLNTIDYPKQNETNISLMSLGAGVGLTRKFEKDAITVNANYINLAPYNKLVPDDNTWHKLPESLSGEAVYRHDTKNGLLKFYSAFEYLNFDVSQKDINFTDLVRLNVKNNNWYSNLSYEGFLTNKAKITAGASYNNSASKVNFYTTKIKNVEHSFHAKVKLKHNFNNTFKLAYGAELQATNFTENGFSTVNFDYNFNNNSSSAFAETDIYFSNNLATKVGARLTHSSLLKETTVAPRLSLAYKFNKEAQLSLAYGNFYQTPQNDELKLSRDFKNQLATHYIANFQYNKNNRLFRAEAYYKKYDNLVTYSTQFGRPTSNFANDGFGYSQGLDIFFKDSKSIKYLQYWLSYSYLDTERKYNEYPTQVMPSFATKHNASLVTKYWINRWRSQLGVTYSFASGRPYNNPNETQFMNGRTKAYNNLSLSFSYLISQQKILYFSANNVLGFNNVNGYQYSYTPNTRGVFDRQAIVPSSKRFFFVGFFWTISQDKTKNMLDNL